MNIEYIRCGDYSIPALKLQEENRSIGKWGRMHRDYLQEHHPIRFNLLVLSGNFHSYLADLNEEAQTRLERIIEQMKAYEGITGELKAIDPLTWAGAMNNIRNRAEETVIRELVYGEDIV